MAQAANKRLVIATATVTLQEQVINKDLPDIIVKTGLEFSYTLAKGRGRYACLSKLDRLLQEEKAATSFLDMFAEQADLTLMFPPELVEGIAANELIGTYTQREGAKILLAGTGLIPTFSNRVVLSIAADDESAPEGGDMNVKRKAGLGAIAAAVFSVGAGAQNVDTPS